MGNRLTISLVVLLASAFGTNVFAAVGRTVGSFDVSASGGAQYSIPISVPPGVAGLQPSLALTYSSHGGDGLLGVGWGLAGLSAITRCNLTYAQDTAVGSPQLTSSDRFCLDGNRLRTTNGSTYGAAGATYQTEIANFSNVTSNGTAGTGPAWFKVQGKNGLTYEYGNTADSAILAAGATSVRVWALNAVRDRNGNAMTFSYTNDTSNGSYRPASIKYTFTGSSGTNNGYSVLFTYQSRPSADQLWKYTVGGQNNQLNYLSSITVNTVNGSTNTMVHGYTLAYTTAPTTSRMRLNSIQECASSFTTDCFTATAVTYQNGQAGWGAEIAGAGNATNLTFSLPIDVNGDGIDDLVYPDPTSGHWYYELGSASGTYAGPYDTGIASTNYQSALAIDFYVNGKKDIIVPNASGNWRVMQFVSAGAAFSYVDTSTSAAGVTAGGAIVGDIDGDGREDLIYAVSGGTGYAQPDYIYYRRNTGGAFSTTQSTLASFPNGNTCQPCVKLGNSQALGNPGYRFTSQTRKLDFNGDGRADLLVYLASCSPEGPPGVCGNISNPIRYTWTLFLSQPNGTYIQADAVVYGIGATPNQPPLTGDFNGDGCTDIAYTVSNFWRLRYGTCGRSGTSSVLGPEVGTSVAYTASPALAVDWDGDGRTDIVEPATGASPDWWVARSVGNNLNAWVDTGAATGGTITAKVADVNGDGQVDLVYVVSNALKSRVHSGAWLPPDLVTSIVDAFGNSVTPQYTSISASNYQSTHDASWPYQDYIGPLYVVYNTTFSDPSNLPSGTYSKQYYYYGAWTNLQGRGFQGFNSYSIVDTRTSLFEHKYFERAFPYTGMMYEDVWATGTLYPKISQASPATITLDATANNQRYLPYFSGVRTNQVEVGGSENGIQVTTALTTYTYDNYGNATNIATSVTDEDPGSPYYGDVWTSTTVSTIAPDASSNWCLNMPTQTTVTNSNNAPGGTAITRTVGYTPDYAKCRETVNVTEPNSATYKVTEAYGFDSFGNIESDVVTGVGMAARTTLINWGTSGQFPTTITNPLSQSITLGFDPNTGMKTSQTDPNYTTANPLKTTWLYDTFGRKKQETRPDGTYTVWTYNDCASNGGCPFGAHALAVTYQIFGTNNSVQNDGTTYFDTIDRPVVANAKTLSGAYARNETRYDNLGRVHQQAMPCVWTSVPTLCPYWTTNTFDVLNRLTESQRPISATNSTLQTTLIGYAGRTTTVTDPNNHVTTKISQVTGNVGRSKDATGYYQNFTYDAFGALLSVADSASNTLSTASYSYGLQPFKTSSTDMDLGPRSYTVDALGEITAYTDAKNQNFSVTYDPLSRPKVRTEPDLTTTWTWGNTAASYNIGQLQSVTAVGAETYSESYSFDSKTRLSVKSITIPNDATYAYTYTYNATTGLPDTLAYPQLTTPSYQLKLQYSYANGLLQGISDATSGTAYWVANAMNPRRQVTQASLGNGLVINRNFDAVTGWVNSLQAGIGGGTGIQNQSYLFDEVGNVTQRQDNNRGLTENFFYDSVNRLSYSTLGGATNLTMTYDTTGLGDIASRSDVNAGAAWTYDPVHKHQVTGAGTGYAFSYDANGNMVTGRGGTMHWYSFNQPSDITNSAGTTQFFYGQDHQYYKQIEGGPKTTTYIGGLLEKVIVSGGYTEFRHLIWADGAMIEVDRTTGTNSDTYYVTQDHLGSSAVITNSAGVVQVSESFNAWGSRRGSNWQGSPSSADNAAIGNTTSRGFTGHTMLDSVKMIHMNGRVYDRVMGRFLSPDPYVSDSFNTQSFNRYSYVLNNPLTSIDPTGFMDTLPNDVIGEIVVNGVRPDPKFPDRSGAAAEGALGGGAGGSGSGGDKGEYTLPEVPVVCDAKCQGHPMPSPMPRLIPFFPSFGQPALPSLPGGASRDLAQSTKPTPPPTPCYASAANNPHSASNARTGLVVGGTVFGLGALVVYTVGFPEAEIITGAILLEGGGTVTTVATAGSGFGELLAGLSAVGDSSLVAANAAGYGAALGGVGGVMLTRSTCVNAGH